MTHEQTERDATNDGDTAMRSSIVDVMGEDSFPASDPPAVWTWDPPVVHG